MPGQYTIKNMLNMIDMLVHVRENVKFQVKNTSLEIQYSDITAASKQLITQLNNSIKTLRERVKYEKQTHGQSLDANKLGNDEDLRIWAQQFEEPESNEVNDKIYEYVDESEYNENYENFQCKRKYKKQGVINEGSAKKRCKESRSKRQGYRSKSHLKSEQHFGENEHQKNDDYYAMEAFLCEQAYQRGMIENEYYGSLRRSAVRMYIKKNKYLMKNLIMEIHDDYRRRVEGRIPAIHETRHRHRMVYVCVEIRYEYKRRMLPTNAHYRLMIFLIPEIYQKYHQKLMKKLVTEIHKTRSLVF